MNKEEACKKIKTELQIQGKSSQTQKIYCYFNEKFLEFTNKDIEKIDEDDVKAFLASLITEKKYDLSSVALARSSLKFFYDDMMRKNILVNIKTPKKQRKIPDVLTKEEVKNLIQNAGSLRNKLLVEFMYSSGLRVSECARLKLNDLNIEEKTGLLKLGKGGKDRFFILSDKLIEDLKNYLKINKEMEYLFPGTEGPVGIRAIQRVVTRIAKKSGIKKHIYCHLLRHAFATHLLEDGVDIRKIQLLLNHSNLQTTSWYTQVSTKELRKVKSPLDSL